MGVINNVVLQSGSMPASPSVGAEVGKFPMAPVRSFTLVRKSDASAAFAPSDATAPHLNTYSTLSNTAAGGGCWTCLVNTQPVPMYGP